MTVFTVVKEEHFQSYAMALTWITQAQPQTHLIYYYSYLLQTNILQC